VRRGGTRNIAFVLATRTTAESEIFQYSCTICSNVTRYFKWVFCWTFFVLLNIRVYIIRKLDMSAPCTIDTVTDLSIIVTGYATAVCWYLYLCPLYILELNFRCYARPSIFITTLSQLWKLHWVRYEITEVHICYRTGGLYMRWGALRAVNIYATVI
jgi:hypothetical protein